MSFGSHYSSASRYYFNSFVPTVLANRTWRMRTKGGSHFRVIIDYSLIESGQTIRTMAQIYDNIEVKFTEGLKGIISSLGVKRVDFCVGYFNLRGWNLVVDQVEQLPGDAIYENDERVFRTCRLLIGMHRPPEELIRQLYSGEE